VNPSGAPVLAARARQPERSRDTRRQRLSRAVWSRAAPWCYALALGFWACSWNLRFSVVMSWLPVAPVVVGSFAVGLCVVHRFGQPLRVPTAVTGPVVLLVLAFVPGALLSSDVGAGPAKVATLAFVVLPVFLAALVLLDNHEARRGWLWTQLLVGAAVAVAAVASTHVSLLQPGRFTLATVDTVSTARFVGVAVVVLLLLGLGSPRRHWWAFPTALLCGMVLVYVGSRGPALFALIAVLVVVVAGGCFAGRRLLPLGILVVVGVVAYFFAQSDGGAGGKRIIDTVQSGVYDDTRQQLLASAVHLGLAHPLGIGWGDFAQDSAIGHELANAQGVAYAHNAFGEAFAEGGVLALLAFGLVVVLALVRLWRLSDHPQEAIVWGTAVYWVLNAMVSSDLVGNRFMWISLACGLAAYRRSPSQNGNDPRLLR
jgi:O-antigen ligase